MTTSPLKFDVNAVAEELRKEHGAKALDFAVQTAKRHLQTAEWKTGAMWLRVVNRLTAAKPTGAVH